MQFHPFTQTWGGYKDAQGGDQQERNYEKEEVQVVNSDTLLSQMA